MIQKKKISELIYKRRNIRGIESDKKGEDIVIRSYRQQKIVLFQGLNMLIIRVNWQNG